MRVPDELQPALFNVFVTSSLTAVNLTMIIYQLAKGRYGRKGKLLLNLHLFQLCLGFAKNVSMVLLAGSTYTDCRATATVEFILYYLWSPAMEAVLFLRARTFSLYPRALSGIVGTLWIVRISLGMYAASTVVAVSPPGDLCEFSSDWAVGDYILVCRLISESAMLGTFAQRVFVMVRNLDGLSQRQQHLRGSSYHALLRNSLVATIACITSYAALTQVVKVPAFAPYTLSVFMIQNMVDSIAVVFLLDDTKNKYKKAAARKDATAAGSSADGSGGSSVSTAQAHLTCGRAAGSKLPHSHSRQAVSVALVGSLQQTASNVS